jgi:hypothetical protein
MRATRPEETAERPSKAVASGSSHAWGHDPEKCGAVFPEGSCPVKELKRDDDSTKSHCALVVLAAPTWWSRPTARHPSPDPTFVAQLIANAEAPSQCHNHLGEGTADALAAYRARQRRAWGAGRLTRQTI